ncbi:C-type natriuretic peptide 2 [Dunckerocampus dactyliophorus]|uniref:C-type natriuretic peptide 2 n=1 Tax=Dunckerocampus dactyliophorus TaxID=161453 RepID=UPI0024066F8E|nr:C-type natriuretic peptide 2 [Dunckerocampus dactyliophorus]
MDASASSVLILIFILVVTAESRPSPPRDDTKVMTSLFGSRISSLLVAPPPHEDATEGSAGRPAPSRGMARSREARPQFLVDFLRRHSKLSRRSRKAMVGGRGCFGMKMDRIGSVSGLGC